ncbi:hypothetical protein [Alkalihalobacillus sp. AL-G]|uniref:hypothetical protein n=1 Tax=Alkalihalobacillus sp. AL-G TaxID=2926399 RepID=UPI002729E3F8|nr:hypothetical protein [Alkalihalobacillus sp. AL-G]WLD91720.1 hypothetical protein MOJ78_11765 [Alkalihalobacillus sp. AL-G]
MVGSSHVETVGKGILEGIPTLAKYSSFVPFVGNGIGITTDHFIGGQSWTSASLDEATVSGATGLTMAAFGVSTGGAGFAIGAGYTGVNMLVKQETGKTTGQHIEDNVIKPVKRKAKDIHDYYFDFSENPRETYLHWFGY